MSAWWLDAGMSNVGNELWEQWKSSSHLKALFFLNRKILWKNIPWRPKCVCQFANWLQAVLDFPVSSNHCRCSTHYKLFLAAKTKVFTNRKTKEHHAPVQRLTISRKTRWAKLDSFNPSLCRLSSFHLPYVKAMTLVRIPLQGLSVVQANCKVIFHTTTNYKSCLACQHFFQIRPITNCKRDKPIKNINICPCDSLNTMMCTNSQTLCTGGLEYLQCRLKNSNKILHLVSQDVFNKTSIM